MTAELRPPAAPAAALAAWRAALDGEVLLPGEPGFAEAAAQDGGTAAPAAIARPATAADVARTVRFAAGNGLPLSVRGGGHGAFAARAGAVLVLLSRLDSVEVRGGGRVDVGGGAVWRQVARALHPHGLALSSGDTDSVGVGGLALTGGVGWLVRRHGLTLDNLLAAEVVTAAGEVLHTDAEHHPDLFWALRGGGGNFGAVTRFTFQAHPLPAVHYGTVTAVSPSRESLAALLRGWRDAMRGADERLNSTLFAMPAEGGAPANCQIFTVWGGGDGHRARAAVAPLLELPGIVRTRFERRSYVSVLQDGGEPDGLEGVVEHALADAPGAGHDDVVVEERNAFLRLDDAVVDGLAGLVGQAPGSILAVRALGGAFGRVAPTATAFGWRDAEALAVFTGVLPPGSGAGDVARLEKAWSAIGEGHGTYGNFHERADGDPFALGVYAPVNAERLRRAKRAWDPGNLFSGNHNIDPAG
ncbi:FAD-binding oxidoreductase [Nocardiopsis potens]|uniref:FAD-binding oxidoreductase n=1 Tax=Nocardiopsis potens TaxID=1246458 RepID=UPI000346B0A5|nr:FAD-binding oxidoreductase [Nocardiopsis potens]